MKNQMLYIVAHWLGDTIRNIIYKNSNLIHDSRLLEFDYMHLKYNSYTNTHILFPIGKMVKIQRLQIKYLID